MLVQQEKQRREGLLGPVVAVGMGLRESRWTTQIPGAKSPPSPPFPPASISTLRAAEPTPATHTCHDTVKVGLVRVVLEGGRLA